MERQVKGIWIPIEIWENKDLTWNEKILFLEIDSFTSKDKDCYFSNEYIANLLGVTENSANRILSSLISKGYVIKTSFDGRRRFVKTAFSYDNADYSQKNKQDTQDCVSSMNNEEYIPNTSNNKEEKEDTNVSKKKAIDYDSIFNAWNEMANNVEHINGIRSLSDKRKKMIESLIKNCSTNSEEIVKLINTIQYADDWVIGKGSRGWAIDFDYLMKNTSNWYVKALEGDMHKKNRHEFDKIMNGEYIYLQSTSNDSVKFQF